MELFLEFIYMYVFRAVGVSMDPIKQRVLTEVHIPHSTRAYNCSGWGGSSSSTVMAAIFIAIAYKHTFRAKEKTCSLAEQCFLIIWYITGYGITGY